MNAATASIAIRVLPLLAAAMTTACAMHAPDFGGHWRDANRYAEAPREIPLHQPYVYAPSPADGTLRNMLQRWTHDAGLHLHYEHGSDYTLFAGVADIRTADLRQAAQQLNAAYAAQGLAVTVEGGQVLVRPVARASTAASP